MTAAVPRASRRRRILRRLLVAIVVLEIAYVAAFEWAARSGRLERWINRRPEKFLVRFESAHSWLPFWVQARGLDLRGQSPRHAWRIRVGSARGLLSPLPLLDRRLRFPWASGEGGEVQIRRAAASPSARLPAVAFPEISGFAPPPDPPRPVRPKWSIELPRIRVQGVESLWLDALRVTGDFSARGGFVLHAGKELEVLASSVELAGGRFVAGEQVLGTELTAEVDLSIAPYPFHEKRGLEALQFVSGRAQLDGRLVEGEVLRLLLTRARWLEFGADPGQVSARIEVRDGALQPGSRLDFRHQDFETRLFRFRATGDAEGHVTVLAGAAGPRTELAVRYEDFEIRHEDASEPEIVGSGLTLSASTPDVRLASLRDRLALRIDLGEARLADFAVYDRLLPPTLDLHILAGSGRVSGGLEADLGERGGRGRFQARVDRAAVRYGSLDFTGDIDLDLRLASIDFERRSFELGGSKLRLTAFRSPQAEAAGPSGEDGWWATVDFDDGSMALAPGSVAEGGFRAHLRDSVPIVGLFATRKELPGWVERLLTVRDLEARGTFRWTPAETALEDVSAPVRSALIRARARFGKERKVGLLLVEWHRLALGVRFDDKRRQFKFVGVRDWFATQDLDRVPAPLQASEAYSQEALASIRFTGVGAEPVALADFSDAPGEAAMGLELVADSLVRGDLDGDGREEAAVLLRRSEPSPAPGLYLAVLADREGRPENLATRRVDDRPSARLRLERGLLVLESGPREAPAALGDSAPGAAGTPSTGATEASLQPVLAPAGEPACEAFHLEGDALVGADCPPPAAPG